MNDITRFHDAEALANLIAGVLEGHSLDIAATALALNLAGVIAGYPLRDRDQVERQVTGLLHDRVVRLRDAGAAALQPH